MNWFVKTAHMLSHTDTHEFFSVLRCKHCVTMVLMYCVITQTAYFPLGTDIKVLFCFFFWLPVELYISCVHEPLKD